MSRQLKIKSASFAAAAVALLAGFPGLVSAGGLHIDINLGVPAPVVRSDVVVVDFDHYCVGYHRNLYDADWRLRNAQIDQWHAQEALDDARHREGEVAVTIEEQEAFIADYEKRVADSDAALAAARAAAGHAADDATDARARLHAFEKRIAGAKDDREAARTLHDAAGLEDAERRIHTNEAAAAAASDEVRIAEARQGDLQAAEAAAATLSDARIRLTDVHGRLPRLHDDLAAAHDDVFAAQQRLDGAIGAVALALHDRDEALWMLHRDEILTGRAEFASCGFTIDLGVWGGHMPRDPEVVHAYFVHPVAYWVDRPVEIQTRIVEVDRVGEISRVRQIQEKHEGPRFHEVVKFEAAVPVETRRAYAQRVTVEREHLIAERTERASAAAEHRAPRIPDTERAEARAIVSKDHAEVRSTRRPTPAPTHDTRNSEPTASSRDRTPSNTNGSRTAKADDKNKDPRNKGKDGQASIDPSR